MPPDVQGLLPRTAIVPVAQDRRQNRIGLTADGRAKYREALSLRRKAQKAFDARIGATKAKRLRKMMIDVASLNV